MKRKKKKTNILLVDDHQVMRQGIRFVLNNFGEYNIIEASSSKEALIRLDENSFDVLITDISMNGMPGDELVKIVLEKFPNIKVIVLSMHDEKILIEKLLNAGVDGYIVKDCGAEEITAAVETVLQGNFYFSQSASQQMMMRYTKKFKDKTKGIVDLSRKEKIVLKLIASESTNREIAEKLTISTRTVESHRRNLMKKTGSKNIVGLVKYAYDTGLVNSQINYLAK